MLCTASSAVASTRSHLKRLSLCAWSKTCWSGSRRRALAIKRASMPCCAPSAMHRSNILFKADGFAAA